MAFDFIRQLIGKAAEQRFQAEIAAGKGPLLDMAKQYVLPIAQAELQAQAQKAAGSIAATVITKTSALGSTNIAPIVTDVIGNEVAKINLSGLLGRPHPTIPAPVTTTGGGNG